MRAAPCAFWRPSSRPVEAAAMQPNVERRGRRSKCTWTTHSMYWPAMAMAMVYLLLTRGAIAHMYIHCTTTIALGSPLLGTTTRTRTSRPCHVRNETKLTTHKEEPAYTHKPPQFRTESTAWISYSYYASYMHIRERVLSKAVCSKMTS